MLKESILGISWSASGIVSYMVAQSQPVAAPLQAIDSAAFGPIIQYGSFGCFAALTLYAFFYHIPQLNKSAKEDREVARIERAENATAREQDRKDFIAVIDTITTNIADKCDRKHDATQVGIQGLQTAIQRVKT
ncbi:MAG: hypothetical protein GY841_02805 [FCB group bacterium]|nr:hypothetical protein [FCB group bacterium]